MYIVISIVSSVGPDIRQCRIIRTEFRYLARKKPDIQHYPAEYPASGNKNRIGPIRPLVVVEEKYICYFKALMMLRLTKDQDNAHRTLPFMK